MEENGFISDIVLVKNALKIAFSVISLIISLLPIILLVSIPLLLMGIFMPSNNGVKYQDLMENYKSVPVEIRQEINSWINNEKANYSSVDEVIIEDNFIEDPNLLVCIDALRYQQKYDKVTKEDIKELCNEIYKKESKLITEKVPVYSKEYQYDSDGNPILDSSGNHVYTEKVDYEERKKLCITISMKSLEEIAADLSLDYEQLKYMYENSQMINLNEQEVGAS